MLRTVSTVALVVALATRVDAQPASAQAEVLFRQGKQHMAAKKFAEACDAFDASQKLAPSVNTLINYADCREQNGQLATAWGLFVDVSNQTRGASDSTSNALNKVASQRAAKLEPKLSKLTITIAPDAKVDGLQITRNREPLDASTWGRTLPIDGGTYAIVAKAPGREEFTTSITVAASGDTKTVTIPKLTESAKQIVQPPPPDEEPDETIEDEVPASSGGSKVVPIVVGAGALALLGGGLALELSARSTYDDAKVEVDNAKQDELWESANRKRYIAQGLAVAGLATAGVAVWLFVRSRGSSEPTTTARGVTVEPMFAIGGGGLLLDGRF
ncbi:MAG TPA: tetratricopeptide repeat protein [Kofleriaceae bacterium]